ncbi:hypothetical protein VNO80_10763 [Phaseolus coccineus]|uniref:Uncharacterized protein n=1 Tax=Phaseolus coccineus TaxID=3886 RepID=A0AAN9REX2_PHACN
MKWTLLIGNTVIVTVDNAEPDLNLLKRLGGEVESCGSNVDPAMAALEDGRQLPLHYFTPRKPLPLPTTTS